MSSIALSEMSILHWIGDFLSILCILSCLVMKIPQIRNIVTLKSAQGMSVYGLLLELFSYSITMMYNFVNGYSMISYLEYPILLVQEYVLIFVVLKYKNMLGRQLWLYAAIYFVILAGFAYSILPGVILVYLVPCCTPIGATSKVIQLIEILRNKDSESISLVTWSISVATNLIRIYTILLDSADKVLLANFAISSLLSTLVLVSAMWYKKPKTKTD